MKHDFLRALLIDIDGSIHAKESLSLGAWESYDGKQFALHNSLSTHGLVVYRNPLLSSEEAAAILYEYIWDNKKEEPVEHGR